MNSFLSSKKYLLMLIFFIVFNAGITAFLVHSKVTMASESLFEQKEFPEMEYLKNNALTFSGYYKYFNSLSEEKGAVYAYDLLKVAPIAEGIDIHLLGHLVGDNLYKQKGVDGIQYCTHHFRNACSHSVVIGHLLKTGEAGIPTISEVCRKAPGGKGAYTMCFHGLGHGVLAYQEYDMKKAVKMCETMGTKDYNDQEYIECVGGAVMEMLSGIHDKEAWEKQYSNFLNQDDPFALCSPEIMPERVQPMCYTYLTPYFFQHAGSDISNLNDDLIKTTFSYCDRISSDQTANRAACYGGFGKEFVVMAPQRDIRQVEELTSAQLLKIYRWCSLAGEQESVDYCVTSAVSSLYWGGENIPDPALNFCSGISNNESRNKCFHELFHAVKYYIDDPEYYTYVCSKSPDDMKNSCRETLL